MFELLVVVKVLDRLGPGTEKYGQYVKRQIVYVEGQIVECLEDPRHIATIIQNCSNVGAKPQRFAGQQGQWLRRP